MKRLSLVLLVLVLATSLFYSCDQQEENGGTGVSVASPTSLQEYTGEIPESDTYIIDVLSTIVQDVGSDIDDLYDLYERYDGSAYTSQFSDTITGYYGGSCDVTGSGRWADSDTATSASHSGSSDTSVTLNGYTSFYDAAVTGVSQGAERENYSVNTTNGDYSLSGLYEFGFSVSMSGADCAGKYILFISASGSQSGTVANEYEFEEVLDSFSPTGTGYLKIYDNSDTLVREITLTQSQMMSLYPNA